jgi:serine/threonine protein phosphatase PrpC
MCAYSNFSNLAGETYQQTDAAFLDSEKDNFRDDGSTASTAVLVDNHLYVANVGDSRTVISTAGKGNIWITYCIMISLHCISCLTK